MIAGAPVRQKRTNDDTPSTRLQTAFVLVFGFLWGQGTLDNLLVHVGLNWETCVQYPFQGNRIECGPEYYGAVDNGWRFWLGF